MTTALDSNILLDVLTPDAPHQAQTRRLLADVVSEGALVISDVVYAEIAANFRSDREVESFLNEAGVHQEPMNRQALFSAGVAWREYSRQRQELTCPACGTSQPLKCTNCGRDLRPRQHLVADFMIGAHALHQADRLLTRDRGFYGTYFPELKLI